MSLPNLILSALSKPKALRGLLCCECCEFGVFNLNSALWVGVGCVRDVRTLRLDGELLMSELTCVFGGDKGRAISPATLRTPASIACVSPKVLLGFSGFISVGISGNEGVDARFFHRDAVVVAFTPRGEVLSLSPNTGSPGDVFHVAGRGLFAPSNPTFRPGSPFTCRWGGAASGASSSIVTPGASVSSALVACQAAELDLGTEKLTALGEASWWGRRCKLDPGLKAPPIFIKV